MAASARIAFYDWPDGKAHSIPYAQHQRNMQGSAFGGAAQSTGGMGSTSALLTGLAHNTAAAAAKPAAAAAPAAPAAAPAPPAPKPPPDPRDSAFTTGVNGLLFNNKNSRDDLTHQGEQATQDFNTMLSRMADNRANDLLAANYGANKQGLFYSGQLGKRRDTVDKGYDQQTDDQRSSYNRANDARTAALNRLGTIVADPNSPTGYSGTGQAGIDLSDLFNQATARQTAANAAGGADLAAAADLGPASTPAPPPTAAPSTADLIKQWVADPIKTTYVNAQGHQVRVHGNGTKEVLINGVWKKA